MSTLGRIKMCVIVTRLYPDKGINRSWACFVADLVARRLSLNPLLIPLLVFAIITLGLAFLRFGMPFTIQWQDFTTMLLDVLLVPSALITLLIFVIAFARLNPEVLLLQAITQISNRTVSFVSAVPEQLEDTLQAKIVQRHDTDGDGKTSGWFFMSLMSEVALTRYN
jgi:hypothetical protein